MQNHIIQSEINNLFIAFTQLETAVIAITLLVLLMFFSIIRKLVAYFLIGAASWFIIEILRVLLMHIFILQTHTAYALSFLGISIILMFCFKKTEKQKPTQHDTNSKQQPILGCTPMVTKNTVFNQQSLSHR